MAFQMPLAMGFQATTRRFDHRPSIRRSGEQSIRRARAENGDLLACSSLLNVQPSKAKSNNHNMIRRAPTHFDRNGEAGERTSSAQAKTGEF